MRGGRQSSSDSTVFDASTAAFRREILPAWRRDPEREEGRMERESRATYRNGLELEIGRD
jgi:hypothetical protein